MNIFISQGALMGGLPEELSFLQPGLLALAADIRQKLGRKSYLLDRYLCAFFEGLCATMPYQILEDADALVTTLHGLALAAVEGEPYDHPLYDRFREWANTHPIDCDDPQTQAAVAKALLADEFLHHELPGWYATAYRKADQSLDALYDQVVALLSSEAPMERINELLRERFITCTASQVLLHGFYAHLASELLTRDCETGKERLVLALEYCSEKGYAL